eukprot:Rhum_TRINITY_DN10122_c0_g1::Rhum_TRINITY_DN10122_c0_g1_i1::g.36774::m.36774
MPCALRCTAPCTRFSTASVCFCVLSPSPRSTSTAWLTCSAMAFRIASRTAAARVVVTASPSESTGRVGEARAEASTPHVASASVCRLRTARCRRESMPLKSASVCRSPRCSASRIAASCASMRSLSRSDWSCVVFSFISNSSMNSRFCVKSSSIVDACRFSIGLCTRDSAASTRSESTATSLCRSSSSVGLAPGAAATTACAGARTLVCAHRPSTSRSWLVSTTWKSCSVSCIASILRLSSEFSSCCRRRRALRASTCSARSRFSCATAALTASATLTGGSRARGVPGCPRGEGRPPVRRVSLSECIDPPRPMKYRYCSF